MRAASKLFKFFVRGSIKRVTLKKCLFYFISALLACAWAFYDTFGFWQGAYIATHHAVRGLVLNSILASIFLAIFAAITGRVTAYVTLKTGVFPVPVMGYLLLVYMVFGVLVNWAASFMFVVVPNFPVGEALSVGANIFWNNVEKYFADPFHSNITIHVDQHVLDASKMIGKATAPIVVIAVADTFRRLILRGR